MYLVSLVQIFAYLPIVEGHSETPANFCPLVKPASSLVPFFCAVPAFKVAIYHEKPLFLHRRSRAQQGGHSFKVLGLQELYLLDYFLRK